MFFSNKAKTYFVQVNLITQSHCLITCWLCKAVSLQHCMNSLQEKPSQKLQINNAIFYLNSYLCEAKSSPEILVLFISIRDEEETNHLAQCVSLFVQMCLNVQ